MTPQSIEKLRELAKAHPEQAPMVIKRETIIALLDDLERKTRVLQIIAAYNMECTVDMMNYHKRLAEKALSGEGAK